MNKKYDVYLAGPIDSISMEEAKEWRKYAQDMLLSAGLTCFDPTNLTEEDDIVPEDLKAIRNSKKMLVNAAQGVETWGTPMELCYAASFLHMPTYVIVPDTRNLRAWVEYYGTYFFSGKAALLDAVELIVEHVNNDTRPEEQ